MSASINITLEVKVSTQKNDKVAVTGAQDVLGGWDPAKIKFLKPKKSLQDNDVWFAKINVPLSCNGLDYRYLVCRKFSSAHGDDAGDESHIIRHWESGIHCRHKTISDLGVNPMVDVYGVFDAGRKMFVDQGWLMDETEIQLRFYKDPIQMFKKRDKADTYNVKCSSINLLHDTFSHQDSSCADQEIFDQVVHASNPLIRVSSLGHYINKEQSAYGKSVSSSDYVVYKLRTYELDSHAVKVDFYKTPEGEASVPPLLGYTNILPLHLVRGSGYLVLAINGSHGLPVGQVTVRYLVCKPTTGQRYNLEKSFTQWWNRRRMSLEIGHRGLGNTHHSDLNSSNSEKEESVKHENTLGSLITAGQSGADFVEFDVMLSKDKVPIIWHDFKVSILLRKRTKGKHRVYNIPVHELSLSQLQDLRVDFVKEDNDVDHTDVHEVTEEVTHRDNLSPFPTLKEALQVIDSAVGFYVELKYPQRRYETKVVEEGIELYFERNVYLDPILRVLEQHAGNRRIVLASFDADICIMARIKQNRYPVIMLIEDLGIEVPYYNDVRTHHISTAIALAKSEKFLGLSINAASLLRKDQSLLEQIFAEHLICFVWGAEANQSEVREELKKKNVHAICHDEIGAGNHKSVLRATNEERLHSVVNEYQKYSDISPDPSVSDSPGSVSGDGGEGGMTSVDEISHTNGMLLGTSTPDSHLDMLSLQTNDDLQLIVPIGKVSPMKAVDSRSCQSLDNNTENLCQKLRTLSATAISDYTSDFY